MKTPPKAYRNPGRLGPTILAVVCLLWPVLFASARTASAQSLRGSLVSMRRQDAAAHRNDFTFIKTPAQLYYFVKQGWLVPVRPNANLALRGVSYPYARPEVALFLRRLGAEYRAACGRKLVITSLTRPEDRQPPQASSRSVHPTGMAVDLRYSHDRHCRRWLEGVLLNLEGAHILEATRERYPPHYHVAVFPARYAAYVQSLELRKAVPTVVASNATTYKVRSGDSLWTIARAHGTTVNDLKQVNGLDDSTIYAGQTLALPTSSSG